MKSIPNDSHDPVREPMFDAYRASDFLARERHAASGGECPDPRELRDLVDGRIDAPWRREALARHIVYCSRCADRNLTQLLADGAETEAAHQDAPTPTIVRRRPMRLTHVAAAAGMLVAAVLGESLSTPPVPPAVGGVYITGESGLEPRTAELDTTQRRAMVAVDRGGYLALARLFTDRATWEAVEGDRLATPVVPGEEVMLPLDRSLPVSERQDWLIVHLGDAATEAELSAWLPRLVRGESVDGVDGVFRVTLAP